MCALLCGCAHVDLGQVDYRVAGPPSSACTNNSNDYVIDGSRCFSLRNKYEITGKSFVKGDFYAIELEQAFVGTNVSESQIFGHNLEDRAEMAILANTFELSATGTERFLESTEYDKAQDANAPKLRLVYYGDDLAARQPFNFSDMIVAPRQQYRGGTVGIQLVVEEIDAQSPAITSLLETLAGYGKTVSPVPQVTDVLLDLGTSLMHGNTDDRLFDFRFMLANAAAILPNGRLDGGAVFAPGHYVIVKSDLRDTDIPWKDWRYDYNTGRILSRSDNKEFRDYMYLILNIRKYPKSSTQEKYAALDWENFRSKVASAIDDRSIPLDKVTTDLRAMIEGDRSKRLKSELAERWNAVEEVVALYMRRPFRDLDQATAQTCAAKADLSRDRDAGRQDIRDAVREFIAAYQTAVPPAPAKSELGSAEKEALVSLASRTFMPWSAPPATSPSANFATAQAFQSAYVDGKTGAELYGLAAEFADAGAVKCTS